MRKYVSPDLDIIIDIGNDVLTSSVGGDPADMDGTGTETPPVDLEYTEW